MLGMYTVSFDAAHQSNFDLAATTATLVQAEQLARTGISLAMTKMGGNSSIYSYNVGSTSIMGGSVAYSATGTSSQSQITSTAIYNGKTVVVKATFVYYNNRWRISRLYVPPVV